MMYGSYWIRAKIVPITGKNKKAGKKAMNSRKYNIFAKAFGIHLLISEICRDIQSKT